MAIEMKLSHKMSLQLVMTPQLQQAIKLLQLSRMELADVMREEMMENPILEDAADTAQEQEREPDAETKMEDSFKGETDLKLLYANIEPNLQDRDFFIRKAIGWALRAYAWTDPREVARYVREHEDRLSGLSRREALKNIS